MKWHKFIVFLLIISFYSCNPNSNLKLDTFLAQPMGKGKGFIQFSTGKFIYLADHFKGEKGNIFEFYKNGFLSTYSFEIDSLNVSYYEKYDSNTHKILSIEGSPILYKEIDANRNPDSIYVTYLVSNFSYDNVQFAISDSNRTFINMPFADSLPNNFSQVKYANSIEFTKNVNGLKRLYLIGRFKGKMKNTNEVITYYDTIDYTSKK